MNSAIYAMKISILKEAETSWVDFMKSHISDVLNTKCFKDYSIKKMLDSESASNQYTTYLIEYEAASLKRIQVYLDNFESDLQKEHTKKFSGKFQESREIYEDQFKNWYGPVDWKALEKKLASSLNG